MVRTSFNLKTFHRKTVQIRQHKDLDSIMFLIKRILSLQCLKRFMKNLCRNQWKVTMCLSFVMASLKVGRVTLYLESIPSSTTHLFKKIKRQGLSSELYSSCLKNRMKWRKYESFSYISAYSKYILTKSEIYLLPITQTSLLVTS